MKVTMERGPGRIVLVAVLAVLSVCAWGALRSSSAQAAPTCTGVSVRGTGSSVQAIAQQNVWTPAFSSTVCPGAGAPTVSYESTNSAVALREWGADGGRATLNHEVAFIGTDEAPNAAQIANIEAAAGGSKLAVIPVTQTSIAIVANPPVGCTVEEITNLDLEQVFRGTFTKWSQIATAEGSCGSPITRVVPTGGMGTTYQFKHYLDLINAGALACIGATWTEIGPITDDTLGTPNVLWPESCAGTTLSPAVRPTGTGGSEEVKKVNATAGSIGFAALTDAKSSKAVEMLNLGNNGLKGAVGATYANPIGEPGVANCTSTEYQVPAEALKVGSGLNVDWSEVFGANNAIGGTAYPLCTLTFDLALTGYGEAGFSPSQEETVHDYLREYVTFAGQTQLELSGSYYAPLPSSTKGGHDVLGAAKYASGKIGLGTVGTVCKGGSIVGEGSTLQAIAQQNVWAPGFASEYCGFEHPTVTYEAAGSGVGLNEWNASGSRGSINTAKAFIGTDDAPTAAQIENMRVVAKEANVAVIPVAQTAIAVIARPPTGCTVGKITNPDLEKVFRGTFTTWSQISTAEGSCGGPITRVVRADGSGTTYQFKNYLSLANPSSLPCVAKTWKELGPITNTVTGKPNVLWPESCTGTTLSSIVRPVGAGGAEEVKAVNATAGSIGYAALPDAEANHAAAILNLGNNGQKAAESATYASPVGAPGTANCNAAVYQVPAEGLKVGTGLNVDWSKSFGANASIGGTAYPLCALTYDLAFNGYQLAGFLQKQEVTVHDYLREFVTAMGQGRLEASGAYYSPLPTSTKGANDVLGAARYASGKIAW
jgi:ABC-type phosphate transport system substrate-binding protein